MKEEKNKKEQVEKKPMFKGKLIILIISACLIIVLALIIIPNIKKKTETTKPLIDKETISYELYKDEGVWLHCRTDENDVEVSTLTQEMIVNCRLGFETYSDYKIKDLSVDLEYGAGFEYLGFEKYDDTDWKVTVKDNTTEATTIYPDSVGSRIIDYRFKVKANASSTNLYINLNNIVFKNYSNDYYKAPDSLNTFVIKSNVYYIYKYSNSDVVVVYDTLQSNNYLEYLATYNCESKTCTYEGGSKEYVLFNDDGLIIYDHKTNKSERIKESDLNKYDGYELVIDNNKPIGIIVYTDDAYGYYSLTKNKYIITPSEKYYYIESAYGGLIIEEYDKKNDTYTKDIIGYDGKEYVPDIDSLEKTDNGNYYYLAVCNMVSCDYFIYNANKVQLLSNILIESFSVNKEGNIIIHNKNNTKFQIYDNKEVLLFESKEYKEVYNLVNDYIVVVDKNNYLKIVDYNDTEVVSFLELTDKHYFHSIISGWYEDETIKKEGIYLIVEDKSLGESDYEEALGYEYYYIPSTKENGHIDTEIGGYAKPVLYLYPKVDNTKINIAFEKPELLTTTYPKYINGWNVIANKNGDLIDKDNKEYYGLYWEESGSTNVTFEEGFYVTKAKAISFLEEKLSLIGLNNRERNEFIMYWLPILEKNEQSLVYFELTEERESYNKIKINPKPDSLLRIAIHVKKANEKANIKEEPLTSFKRVGFTAVEWGGVIH